MYQTNARKFIYTRRRPVVFKEPWISVLRLRNTRIRITGSNLTRRQLAKYGNMVDAVGNIAKVDCEMYRDDVAKEKQNTARVNLDATAQYNT